MVVIEMFEDGGDRIGGSELRRVQLVGDPDLAASKEVGIDRKRAGPDRRVAAPGEARPTQVNNGKPCPRAPV
jgi:hypothetical protein